MWGTHTRTISERINTYILPWDEHINHVRKAQHLYLTMGWTHQPFHKGSTLTSDHDMNTTTMSEGLSTYILPWDEHINHVRKALHLYLIMWDEHIPQSHQNGFVLIYDHGMNISTMSERLTDSSLPFGGNLDLENTKLLPEGFKLHSAQWLCQCISYLFVHPTY